MSDPWYPGAIRDPGAAANYAHGHNAMVSVVCHYTVGVDSRALLRDGGLCQFLVSRDGTVWQFSEVDAVCWHAGQPYNSRGPGIEVEWYEPHDGPDIFTPEAEKATGALVSWLHDEHGISLDYKNDAPRVADWLGFIAHRAVIEDADYHSDYWPHLPTGDNTVALELADFAWLQNNISGQGIDGKTNITNRMVLDAILAIGSVAPVPGAGLTEAQVRAIVRSELDATHLAH